MNMLPSETDFEAFGGEVPVLGRLLIRSVAEDT